MDISAEERRRTILTIKGILKKGMTIEATKPNLFYHDHRHPFRYLKTTIKTAVNMVTFTVLNPIATWSPDIKALGAINTELLQRPNAQPKKCPATTCALDNVYYQWNVPQGQNSRRPKAIDRFHEDILLCQGKKFDKCSCAHRPHAWIKERVSWPCQSPAH
jgi:hypothetical protein